MFIDYATLNVNNSALEPVLKTCLDSRSTWLIAHAFYALYMSVVIFNLVQLLDIIIVYSEDWFRIYPNLLFNNEWFDDAPESETYYFCVFVYQRLLAIFLYVGAAWLYHSIMSDAPVSSIFIGRWFIEATVDIQCPSALLKAYRLMFSNPAGYRFPLRRLNSLMILLKLYKFYFFREAEFYSDSELNFVLVIVFRRVCTASHYAGSSKKPVMTFLSELKEAPRDIMRVIRSPMAG
jgi:hypothetical protein